MSNAELIMKLKYEINKFIHDRKYDGVDKEKMFRVYRELIPGFDLRHLNLRDLIGKKLEEFLQWEIHPLEINAL